MVEAPWLLTRPRLARAGAHQALVVDAAVRIEARVLDGQHRVLHHLGDLGDRRQVAPLLAEFADQHAVGGEHPQRQLGPVVRQVGDVRQVGIGHRQGDAADDHDRQPRRPAAMPDSSRRRRAAAKRCQAGRRAGRGRARRRRDRKAWNVQVASGAAIIKMPASEQPACRSVPPGTSRGCVTVSCRQYGSSASSAFDNGCRGRTGKILCATRMLLLALKWNLKFVTP